MRWAYEDLFKQYCDFRLKNGKDNPCLWKKYVLNYFQKQGKKYSWPMQIQFFQGGEKHLPLVL